MMLFYCEHILIKFSTRQLLPKWSLGDDVLLESAVLETGEMVLVILLFSTAEYCLAVFLAGVIALCDFCGGGSDCLVDGDVNATLRIMQWRLQSLMRSSTEGENCPAIILCRQRRMRWMKDISPSESNWNCHLLEPSGNGADVIAASIFCC